MSHHGPRIEDSLLTRRQALSGRGWASARWRWAP